MAKYLCSATSLPTLPKPMLIYHGSIRNKLQHKVICKLMGIFFKLECINNLFEGDFINMMESYSEGQFSIWPLHEWSSVEQAEPSYKNISLLHQSLH